MIQEGPTVSVLIPAYNEEAYIESCLKSISKQDTSFPYEIVVCDDASTDRTADILSRKTETIDQLSVIANEQNEGIIYSCNKLLSNARGTYFIRIDADSVMKPGTLSTIHSKVTDGYPLVFGHIDVKNTSRLHPAACQVGKIRERSTWYGGACIAGHHEQFVESGGFDQQMIAAEDQELKQRAKTLDWSVAYLDEAGVESNFPTALRPVFYRKYDSSRSHIRQYKNNPEDFTLWEIRGPIFWTMFVVLGLSSVVLPVLTLLSLALLVVPLYQYVHDAPLAASVSGRPSFLLLYPLYEAAGGIVRMFGLWSDMEILVDIVSEKYL
jgi:glycosyltransferase involved in cell wall biosynthesis